MLIIGEKINSTRKAIGAALAARDAAAITAVALEQAKAGAQYLDVNGGDPRPGQEAANMAWLIDLVQASTDCSICIDTADPAAAEVGLKLARNKPIINSVTLERNRLQTMLPMVTRRECMVIALLMSDGGTPQTVDDRLRNTEVLVGKLTSQGVKPQDIIVDPAFLPVSTDTTYGTSVIQSIAAIRKAFPEVHVGGGVSNISYGLPKRKYINLVALVNAIYHGMDVGIIDPTMPGIIGMIYAAEALAGRDEFCMNYVTADREGRITA
jgi:5-methyltetrahydrofolate--homocysteine methyltransferase